MKIEIIISGSKSEVEERLKISLDSLTWQEDSVKFISKFLKRPFELVEFSTEPNKTMEPYSKRYILKFSEVQFFECEKFYSTL